MKSYPLLSALSGIFRVLGILGIVASVLLFVFEVLNGPASNFGGALAQTLSALFGSLVLLGLSELFAAVLEIVANLRSQKEAVARIEIKVNNLNPPS